MNKNNNEELSIAAILDLVHPDNQAKVWTSINALIATAVTAHEVKIVKGFRNILWKDNKGYAQIEIKRFEEIVLSITHNENK